MALNLESLSPKELQDLIVTAQSKMKAAQAGQIQAVRTKIDALLKSNGLTLDEVYPTRRSKSAKAGKKSSVAPKYRNPANPEQTWSGRGKRPLWLAGALKKRGVTLESFLIEGGTAKVPAKKATATKKAPKKKAAKK
ncbi:MAG: H-NS family nucleoid-associated regulatory protein [Rhodanobacter sp.]